MRSASSQTKPTHQKNKHRKMIDSMIKQFWKNKPIPKNKSATARKTNINQNETGQKSTQEKACSHVSLEKQHPSQSNVNHNESEQR